LARRHGWFHLERGWWGTLPHRTSIRAS
jgi:hypothetical protein